MDLKQNSLLLSMGDFEDYGDWSLDTQFVVNMGVPYLIAHGLGNPVADAKTIINFPSAGTYSIKVYTYNWVAPWKPELSAGTFQIKVGETLVNKIFGAEGNDWGWHDGGRVEISQTKTTIALHDLTGFEGRCGLVFFTKEHDFTPPTEINELVKFYREMTNNTGIKEQAVYDVVVCGAGIAGICAALSSARQGLSVALVQDRPVVGGNNSSEVRVWLGGETNFEPYPGVGNIVNELEQEKVGHYGSTNIGENYEDDRKLELLKEEKNITVYLSHIMTDVGMEQNKIKAIEVFDVKNNCYRKLTADLFVDSTGDATLGYLSGADYEVTTNGHMGMTNMWYIEDTGKKQEFPRCPWAIDLSNVDFPGRKYIKDVYDNQRNKSLGCWFWESGCEVDPIEKAEYARDVNLRAMYGAWDCVKNVDNDYTNFKLGYSAFIGGKRESRRLFGDVVLTKSEVSTGLEYDDRCVPSTWNFDVHYPDRRFYSAFHEGDGFITKDYHEPFNKPYFIPYRCMYSRNVSNLFMAGRNVSVSHDALGTVRVMRTGGMMGEVVGIAAKVCKNHNVLPRDVYTSYLDEFKGILKSIPKCMYNKLVSNVHSD